MRKGRLIELLSKYQSDMVEVYKQPLYANPVKESLGGCTGNYADSDLDVDYWVNVVNADELRGE